MPTARVQVTVASLVINGKMYLQGEVAEIPAALAPTITSGVIELDLPAPVQEMLLETAAPVAPVAPVLPRPPLKGRK
jgi:hypothetical protein